MKPTRNPCSEELEKMNKMIVHLSNLKAVIDEIFFRKKIGFPKT